MLAFSPSSRADRYFRDDYRFLSREEEEKEEEEEEKNTHLLILFPTFVLAR